VCGPAVFSSPGPMKGSGELIPRISDSVLRVGNAGTEERVSGLSLGAFVVPML
jgi:hypothetical protein